MFVFTQSFPTTFHQANNLIATLEQLIEHGLHALRETLQQDKELTIHNTSVGVVGPAGQHDVDVDEKGSFRILEEERVEPFITALPPKEAPGGSAPPAAPQPAAATPGDEDVQMAD